MFTAIRWRKTNCILYGQQNLGVHQSMFRTTVKPFFLSINVYDMLSTCVGHYDLYYTEIIKCMKSKWNDKHRNSIMHRGNLFTLKFYCINCNCKIVVQNLHKIYYNIMILLYFRILIINVHKLLLCISIRYICKNDLVIYVPVLL